MPQPAGPARPVLTVAITGLNAVDSPGPGVAVARALQESPDFEVRLIGLSYETLEPGIYLPGLFAHTYQLPYPSAGTAALLARLEEIHAREQLQVIIPNFDAELYNFIKVAPQLRARGIATVLPSLAAFGAQHGLQVPADCRVHHLGELPAASRELGWPLVLKGRFYDAVVAHTQPQAEQAFLQLSAR